MREILIAGAIALFLSLFGTPGLIRILARRGYGQIIRDDGPSSHHTKRGTPTMGGIIIIFATAVGYFIAHAISRNTVSTSALLVLGLMAGLGFLGFLDDWLKVSRQKSLGLNAKQKIFGQIVVAATFAYLGINFPDRDGITPISQNLSTVRDTSITLGTTLVIIWVVIMVTATSNGVNLTDGLDGLATGAAVMTFIAFILIGVWEFGQSCAVSPGANCYLVRDPLDILIPLGGLFVIISASVILQVAYFKISGGKRIFKMAPLQHHFELMGWGEVTIVLRFWIIAGLCVAAGLGLFYAQWVTA